METSKERLSINKVEPNKKNMKERKFPTKVKEQRRREGGKRRKRIIIDARKSYQIMIVNCSKKLKRQ